jgi:1-acyl-sn-glycerol-3-phosphate acyltransferase
MGKAAPLSDRPDRDSMPRRALPRALRQAYEYLVFYAALAYFGTVGIAFTCLCALLAPLLPRRAGERVGRDMIGALFRSYLAMLKASGLVKLDLDALDALRGESGIVIAPNHPSLFDAVLVISCVPRVGCIMKAPIWDNPVLGGGARLSGYVRSDAPRAMVRLGAAALRRGEPLLVFPEGTRTRGGCVNRFKGGFALIAKHAQAPIQTVFIDTNSAFLGKGWPLLRKPGMPVMFRARLGRRFRVEGDVHRFVSRLEDYYREELTRVRGAAAACADPEAELAAGGHA